MGLPFTIYHSPCVHHEPFSAENGKLKTYSEQKMVNGK